VPHPFAARQTMHLTDYETLCTCKPGMTWCCTLAWNDLVLHTVAWNGLVLHTIAVWMTWSYTYKPFGWLGGGPASIVDDHVKARRTDLVLHTRAGHPRPVATRIVADPGAGPSIDKGGRVCNIGSSLLLTMHRFCVRLMCIISGFTHRHRPGLCARASADGLGKQLLLRVRRGAGHVRLRGRERGVVPR
jgi:hypothetical protein